MFACPPSSQSFQFLPPPQPFSDLACAVPSAFFFAECFGHRAAESCRRAGKYTRHVSYICLAKVCVGFHPSHLLLTHGGCVLQIYPDFGAIMCAAFLQLSFIYERSLALEFKYLPAIAFIFKYFPAIAILFKHNFLLCAVAS